MLRIELELLGIGQLPAVLQGRFNLVREPAASVTHIVFSSAVFDLLGTVYPGSSNGILGPDPGLGSSCGIMNPAQDLEPYLRNRFILGYCRSFHSETATPTVHSALESHFHKIVIVDNSDLSTRIFSHIIDRRQNFSQTLLTEKKIFLSDPDSRDSSEFHDSIMGSCVTEKLRWVSIEFRQ